LAGESVVAALRRNRCIVFIACAALGVALAAPARAQGRLEARYVVTLAGVPIGKGNWVVEIDPGHYNAATSGITTGLMHVLTHGEGTSAVRGTLNGGKPQHAIFASTIKSRKKTDEVRITLDNGDVKDFRADPPPDQPNRRVPITDAQRRGVFDPLTASLLRVPGHGDLMAPDTCMRTLPVFDGRLRYNLQLAYKRMDTVKADKGYAGPVLVCSVIFTPLGGYIPSHYTIKYLSEARGIEVWLAPIAGTRVLVPFRVQGPTPIGEAVLEATQFVTVATPTRASADVPKAH
jgi:Protein of unknown function (DUF3108)